MRELALSTLASVVLLTSGLLKDSVEQTMELALVSSQQVESEESGLR